MGYIGTLNAVTTECLFTYQYQPSLCLSLFPNKARATYFFIMAMNQRSRRLRLSVTYQAYTFNEVLRRA